MGQLRRPRCPRRRATCRHANALLELFLFGIFAAIIIALCPIHYSLFHYYVCLGFLIRLPFLPRQERACSKDGIPSRTIAFIPLKKKSFLYRVIGVHIFWSVIQWNEMIDLFRSISIREFFNSVVSLKIFLAGPHEISYSLLAEKNKSEKIAIPRASYFDWTSW